MRSRRTKTPQRDYEDFTKACFVTARNLWSVKRRRILHALATAATGKQFKAALAECAPADAPAVAVLAARGDLVPGVLRRCRLALAARRLARQGAA